MKSRFNNNNSITGLLTSNGDLFRRVVPNINIFTPCVICYFPIDKGEIELSSNNDNTMFGVSIVKDNKHLTGHGFVSNNIKQAIEYCKSIIEKYKIKDENED
jgi:hypothetical protein